ncbi:MAG: hypothetical protein ACM3OF_03070 [Gemmatimonas sp.]
MASNGLRDPDDSAPSGRPHAKFAIRPFVVRCTNDGQRAAFLCNQPCCPSTAPVDHGITRRIDLAFFLEAALGTSIASIFRSQRRLRFAGLLKPMQG